MRSIQTFITYSHMLSAVIGFHGLSLLRRSYRVHVKPSDIWMFAYSCPWRSPGVGGQGAVLHTRLHQRVLGTVSTLGGVLQLISDLSVLGKIDSGYFFL